MGIGKNWGPIQKCFWLDRGSTNGRAFLLWFFLRSIMDTQIRTLFRGLRVLFNGLCLRPIPKPFTTTLWMILPFTSPTNFMPRNLVWSHVLLPTSKAVLPRTWTNSVPLAACSQVQTSDGPTGNPDRSSTKGTNSPTSFTTVIGRQSFRL